MGVHCYSYRAAAIYKQAQQCCRDTVHDAAHKEALDTTGDAEAQGRQRKERLSGCNQADSGAVSEDHRANIPARDRLWALLGSGDVRAVDGGLGGKGLPAGFSGLADLVRCVRRGP